MWKRKRSGRPGIFKRVMMWTKTKLTVTGLTLLAAVAVAVWVKGSFYPAVKNSYFELNYFKFRQLPKNLLLVRPTHFTSGTGIMATTMSPRPGRNVLRMMGRNVPLEQVIAMAYGCNPARVVPPVVKPNGNFDFLVTLSDQPRERFQAAIQKKLGYTTHWEDRDADVLLLKTIAPDPPAFKLSTDPAVKSYFQSGKYWFFHMRPADLTGYLESSFKQPVLDRTGMTNFYDFSVAITWRMKDEPTLDDLKNTLGRLGLRLEKAAEPVGMLVVEDAR
jgi:uncharacterized protein (TIGR03435 family)